MTLSPLKRRFIFLTLFFLSLGLILFSEQILNPFFPHKKITLKPEVPIQKSLNKLITQPRPIKATPTDSIKKKNKTSKNKLTERSLKQSIQNQKGYLYIQRCYASYLQSNPHWQGGGKITVHFIAHPKGVIRNTRVLHSSFTKAESFHQCIATVFDRIKIKSFTGEPIEVNFPLNLF